VAEARTDRELLQQIVEREGIETEPGLSLEALLQRLWDWLAGQLGEGPALDLDGVWQLAGVVGLGLLLVAIAWVAWAVWSRRSARPRTAPRPVLAEALPLVDPTIDAVEAALAAGDAHAALQALWAEVAARLGQSGVSVATGEDATHQELVRAARAARPDWSGHPELRTLARRFDRLCYGAIPPRVADVRALIGPARGLPA